MDLHVIIYLGLALAYFEAALESLSERKRRCACREIIVAFLYVSIAALMVFDPNFLPAHPTAPSLPA